MQGKFAGVQINQNSGTPGADLPFRTRGAASINAGNSPLIVVDGFELSSYAGIQTVSKTGRPDLMSAPEFAAFKKKIYEDAAKYEGYTGGVPAQHQNPSQYQPGDGTNWFDVLLIDAPTQDYDLSISSGTPNLKSIANLNYNPQDGVMLNQWAERFTARSNNIYTVNEKLNLGANLGITYRNQNITPGLGEGRNIIQVAYLTDPTLTYRNADGTYPIGFAPPGMFSTPNYYQVLNKAVNLTRILTLIGNAYGTYEIVDGLKFKPSININTENAINRTFSPSTIRGGTQPAASASASYNTNYFLSWLAENTLTYTKTFNEKHNLEAFVGYTAQKVNYENSNINGSQFPDDNIQYLNVAATRIGNVGASDFSLLSMIGRINYNYTGKYLLSLAVRRDGSSRFGSNTKYGTFPSVSAGWILSDEDFIAIISLSACKKDFLNLDPKTSLSSTFFFKDKGQFDQALTAAFEILLKSLENDK